MSSFLGIEIEHNKQNPTIPLDIYIQEMLAEYKASVTKFLKPNQAQMQPGIMLEQEDCPKSPDPVLHNMYRSYVAKRQFAASWVRCDIAFTASFCASHTEQHCIM